MDLDRDGWCRSGFSGCCGDRSRAPHPHEKGTSDAVDIDGIHRFLSASEHGRDTNTIEITMTDVNNDDRSDIIVSDYDERDVGVLLSNGPGAFAPIVVYRSHSTSFSLSVSDLSGDTIRSWAEWATCSSCRHER